MQDFNEDMGLQGMGVYRNLMGVMGTFELIEGFDVAGGGGASEARRNLSSRPGQAGAEEVSTSSHLLSSMLCFALVLLALLQGFGCLLLAGTVVKVLSSIACQLNCADFVGVTSAALEN